MHGESRECKLLLFKTFWILNQSIARVIEKFLLLKMSYFNEFLEEMSVKVSG